MSSDNDMTQVGRNVLLHGLSQGRPTPDPDTQNTHEPNTDTAEAVVALTASLESVSTSHDGHTAFTFELHFSEELGIGYATLRDDAFAVTAVEQDKVRLDIPVMRAEP